MMTSIKYKNQKWNIHECSLQKYENTRKVLDCNYKVSYKISQNIQLPSNDTT